ncbi:MAG: oligosaccharide flippase family protein [bacterium]
MKEVDSVALANKVGVVVASKVIASLIELAVIILLARLLPKEQVAVVAFLLLVHQTAHHLATFGFPESVFYFFERVSPGARRALVLQTGGLLCVSAAIAAGAILALSGAVPWILSDWSSTAQGSVSSLLPILALAVFLEIPTWPANNVLLACDRQRQAAWYQIITSVMIFLALVGPLLLGYGIEACCWALVGYAGLRTVGSTLWLRAVLPPSTEIIPPGMLRHQVSFSIPLGLNALSSRLNRYVDRFVVSFMLPAYVLAEYQVGAQEVPFIPAIAYATGSVLISRYVALEVASRTDDLIDLWYRGIRAITLLVVPATVVLLVISRDLVLLLFGPSYEPAVLPFQIYSLILLFRVTQYGAMMQTFGDTKGILAFTLTTLLVNLVLSVPFTWALGIPGTALATLIATYLGFYLYLRRIGKHLGLPFWRVLPLGHYGRVLGLAVGCGALSWLLRYGLLQGLSRPIAVAITAAVFLGAYSLVGTLTGLITRQSWSVVFAWLRLRFLFHQ